MANLKVDMVDSAAMAAIPVDMVDTLADMEDTPVDMEDTVTIIIITVLVDMVILDSTDTAADTTVASDSEALIKEVKAEIRHSVARDPTRLTRKLLGETLLSKDVLVERPILVSLVPSVVF